MVPAFFAALCFVTIFARLSKTFQELSHVALANFQLHILPDAGCADVRSKQCLARPISRRRAIDCPGAHPRRSRAGYESLALGREADDMDAIRNMHRRLRHVGRSLV